MIGMKDKGGKRVPNCVKKAEDDMEDKEAEEKPDYIDIDKDGNKTESMKDAAKDKKAEDDMEEEQAMCGTCGKRAEACPVCSGSAGAPNRYQEL